MENLKNAEKTPPDPNLAALMQEMLEAQLALGDSINSTSQLLRFVLSLANENLGVIKTQLETIQNLASAIADCNCA